MAGSLTEESVGLFLSYRMAGNISQGVGIKPFNVG